MLASIKVRDYMAKSLITLRPHMELFQAISILEGNRITAAPVVDDEGDLVGILSEGDCLKAIINSVYYKEAGGKVSDYMTLQVETVGPEDDILDIAVSFNTKRRGRYPVIQDGLLVGLISQRDILRAVKDITQNPKHGS